MVKGKLERKYKLIHNGRELSKGLLSEAGKYDAMQILVQRFDEGRPGAIDPDEVEIIDVTQGEKLMEVIIGAACFSAFGYSRVTNTIAGFFGILCTCSVILL